MNLRLVSKLSVGLLVVAAALLVLATSARADRTRLTHAGVDGDAAVDAFNPALSRNATTGDLLLLWTSSERFESNDIYAQQLDANGASIGEPQLISQRGSDLETEPLAMHPASAFGASDGATLAVWAAEADVAGEMEIFGRVLSTSKGRILPPNLQPSTPPFRISNMGAASNPSFDATHPAVAYDSLNNQFLVVWQADDTLDNKSEIYAQLVAADGQLVGTRQQLSQTGDAANVREGSFTPALAFDAAAAQFTVAWNGTDAIYGRQLAASTLQAGAVQQLTAGKAGQPHLASGNGSTLLTYTAKQAAVFHAFAQPLGTNLALDGAAIQLSEANSAEPHATYDPTSNSFAVAWRDQGGTRLLSAVDIAFRTVSIAADGSSNALGTLQAAGRPAWAAFGDYTADRPALVAADGAFTLVWQADGDVSNEFEIYMTTMQTSVPTAVQLTQAISGSAPVQLLLLALGGVVLMTLLLVSRQRYATPHLNPLPRERRQEADAQDLNVDKTSRS